MAVRFRHPSRMDVLLARPIDGGWPAAIFQFLLATSLLWIALGLALTLRESWIARLPAGSYAWSPPPLLLRFAHFVDLRSATGGLACVLAAMLISWSVVAWTHRPKRTSPRSFIRRWYRSVLIAMPLVGLATVLDVTREGRGTTFPIELALAATWCVLLPALLRDTDPRPHRRARWRPVCPECGYSIIGNISGRCSECGHELPERGESSHTRRWAILRPAWERLHRPSRLTAYLQTVMLLVFRPMRAGWQLGHADRWGRALRWAAAHALLGALLATTVLHYNVPGQLAAVVLGQASPQSLIPGSAPAAFPSGTPAAPLARQALWGLHTFLAWLAVFAFLPALAAVAGATAFAAVPAARAGAVKMGLYLTGTLPLLMLAGGVALLLFATLKLSRPAWLPSPWLLATPTGMAILYGLWWGAGAAWNPHLRQRGCFVALGLAAVFMACWLFCANVLFDAGTLESLL